MNDTTTLVHLLSDTTRVDCFNASLVDALKQSTRVTRDVIEIGGLAEMIANIFHNIVRIEERLSRIEMKHRSS